MIVVVGNTTEDLVLAVDQLAAPGESRLATPIARSLGGKGANQAIAAARAGAAVHLVTALGDDEAGHRLAHDLKAEPLARLTVHRVGAATDLSFIQVDPSGQNVIVSTHACALGLDTHRLDEVELHPGDTLLVQANLDLDATLALMRRARAAGAEVALNPSPTVDGLDRLVPHADLLIVNQAEALGLGGGASPLEAARTLTSGGAREVVVTLGADGAAWVRAHETLHAAAPATTAVDTTGAGDVVCGVLLAFRQRGAEPAEALDRAMRAASLATTRIGAHAGMPAQPQPTPC